MKRPSRAFFATVSDLEERALQAVLAPPPAESPPSYNLGFGLDPSPQYAVTQEVGQQSGGATVILSRSQIPGTIVSPEDLPLLQVRVTTDPTSPHVGVNVGAVDQTVTFAPGQRFAALTVPILAGAPNPGHVQVELSMRILDPAPARVHNIPIPYLFLTVLAHDTSLPPTILATNGTPRGIELTFSEPMDPAQASNVKNYAVIQHDLEPSPDFSLQKGSVGEAVSRRVPLKSAVYDAATNTVTLITRRRLDYGGLYGRFGHSLVVTQGRRPQASRGPIAGSRATLGLVDLAGHPIFQSPRSPRKFRVEVGSGFRPVPPRP